MSSPDSKLEAEATDQVAEEYAEELLDYDQHDDLVAKELEELKAYETAEDGQGRREAADHAENAGAGEPAGGLASELGAADAGRHRMDDSRSAEQHDVEGDVVRRDGERRHADTRWEQAGDPDRMQHRRDDNLYEGGRQPRVDRYRDGEQRVEQSYERRDLPRVEPNSSAYPGRYRDSEHREPDRERDREVDYGRAWDRDRDRDRPRAPERDWDRGRNARDYSRPDPLTAVRRQDASGADGIRPSSRGPSSPLQRPGGGGNPAAADPAVAVREEPRPRAPYGPPQMRREEGLPRSYPYPASAQRATEDDRSRPERDRDLELASDPAREQDRQRDAVRQLGRDGARNEERPHPSAADVPTQQGVDASREAGEYRTREGFTRDGGSGRGALEKEREGGSGGGAGLDRAARGSGGYGDAQQPGSAAAAAGGDDRGGRRGYQDTERGAYGGRGAERAGGSTYRDEGRVGSYRDDDRRHEQQPGGRASVRDGSGSYADADRGAGTYRGNERGATGSYRDGDRAAVGTYRDGDRGGGSTYRDAGRGGGSSFRDADRVRDPNRGDGSSYRDADRGRDAERSYRDAGRDSYNRDADRGGGGYLRDAGRGTAGSYRDGDRTRAQPDGRDARMDAPRDDPWRPRGVEGSAVSPRHDRRGERGRSPGGERQRWGPADPTRQGTDVGGEQRSDRVSPTGPMPPGPYAAPAAGPGRARAPLYVGSAGTNATKPGPDPRRQQQSRLAEPDAQKDSPPPPPLQQQMHEAADHLAPAAAAVASGEAASPRAVVAASAASPPDSGEREREQERGHAHTREHAGVAMEDAMDQYMRDLAGVEGRTRWGSPGRPGRAAPRSRSSSQTRSRSRPRSACRPRSLSPPRPVQQATSRSRSRSRSPAVQEAAASESMDLDEPSPRGAGGGAAPGGGTGHGRERPVQQQQEQGQGRAGGKEEGRERGWEGGREAARDLDRGPEASRRDPEDRERDWGRDGRQEPPFDAVRARRDHDDARRPLPPPPGQPREPGSRAPYVAPSRGYDDARRDGGPPDSRRYPGGGRDDRYDSQRPPARQDEQDRPDDRRPVYLNRRNYDDRQDRPPPLLPPGGPEYGPRGGGGRPEDPARDRRRDEYADRRPPPPLLPAPGLERDRDRAREPYADRDGRPAPERGGYGGGRGYGGGGGGAAGRDARDAPGPRAPVEWDRPGYRDRERDQDRGAGREAERGRPRSPPHQREAYREGGGGGGGASWRNESPLHKRPREASPGRDRDRERGRGPAEDPKAGLSSADIVRAMMSAPGGGGAAGRPGQGHGQGAGPGPAGPAPAPAAPAAAPGLTAEQKRKLLWGSKKVEAVVQPGAESVYGTNRWDRAAEVLESERDKERFGRLMGLKAELPAARPPGAPDAPERPPSPATAAHLAMTREQQERVLGEVEAQYLAGLRRKDGRTTGLGVEQ